MDMSQHIFCAEIERENAGRLSCGKRFVRARAIEMHMAMSGEAFCAEIYRENAGRYIPGPAFCASLLSRNAHGHATRGILRGNLRGKMPNAPDTISIEHRALTVTVRTPQVWPRCLGNMYRVFPGRGKVRSGESGDLGPL